MEISKYKINARDKKFSDFARALALPIRVLIVRRIIENGFSINKTDLDIADYTKENIMKHIGELRTLGIIKIAGSKGHITYTIDQNEFTQMIKGFLTVFGGNIFAEQAVPEKFEMGNTPAMANINKDELSPSYSHFGAFIKKHREELHLTQAVFAKKINIDRSQLSRIECGKTAAKPDKIKTIAKALYLSYQIVRKEYYSCQLVEIIDESGYDQTVLNSAQQKIAQLTLQRSV
jgi:transcriptional regulator with XRE-family HTH domain